MTDWRDQLAGHRMQVDQEFADRIRDSKLTSQEWSLVMTAVEFDVEGQGEEARLVSDTSKIDAVVAEFDALEQPGPGAAGGGANKGGLWDSITDALGLGSEEDAAKREEAIELANEYTTELQRHLEAQGRWESVHRAANAESDE